MTEHQSSFSRRPGRETPLEEDTPVLLRSSSPSHDMHALICEALTAAVVIPVPLEAELAHRPDGLGLEAIDGYATRTASIPFPEFMEFRPTPSELDCSGGEFGV